MKFTIIASLVALAMAAPVPEAQLGDLIADLTGGVVGGLISIPGKIIGNVAGSVVEGGVDAFESITDDLPIPDVLKPSTWLDAFRGYGDDDE